MTPAELRAELARLGLTQSEAARRLGIDPRTMRRWCGGEYDVPAWVPVALRGLAA